jgi:hypothetical protein
MANCHKNFLIATDSYHSSISLDDTKKEFLKISKKNLRKHIKNKFQEKDRPTIKFQTQGSFSMDTAVNPLDGDYDIDDGLYFKPQLDNRPNPETVHTWVVEAAKSYKTVDPPIDKNRCVRVPFKAGYHVDIPIYDLIENSNGTLLPELAIKGDGWQCSDPKKLSEWFQDRVSQTNSELRRLVRYFKAWTDYQNQSDQYKMPSGMVLTILASEEYQYDDRDDVAFAQTAAGILQRIKYDESIPNPVDKSEDLRERITDPQFENFKTRLDTLVQHSETALNHESAEEAAKKNWQKVLGDRFPVIEDAEKKGEKAKTQKTAGIIGIGSESA